MGAAVESLTKLLESEDRYDIPYSELLPRQLEAANERFQERRNAIKLVANRAETGNINEIRSLDNVVPLLFAHTTYKSYPEPWFTQGKWDRMGKWLDTLSTNRVEGINLDNVTDVDDWLRRLETNGHFVAASSGTTGKCSMANASQTDLNFVHRHTGKLFGWTTGIPMDKRYRGYGLAAVPPTKRNRASSGGVMDNFTHATNPFPTEAMTVGAVSRMVALRRSVADGTARPADIADYDAKVASREQALEKAITNTAESIVANRGDKLLFLGMFAMIYRIVERIREMGYSKKDFNADNALYVGGGLKGAKLPADYREQIVETLNIRHICQHYAMQEINTQAPRCAGGRYHLAPWVMPLILDEPGEKLVGAPKGEVEGRAAFFDLSLDGRWGGVISGDKIHVNFGKCACGRQGPTVGADVVRYADLKGGADKITCAGTIDAYIRGVT
jgi:hypothetical protein